MYNFIKGGSVFILGGKLMDGGGFPTFLNAHGLLYSLLTFIF